MTAPEKKDDAVEAIARLIRLTQEGQVKWVIAGPRGDLQNRDGFEVTFVFATKYKERRLRLYGYRRKVEDPGPFGVRYLNLSSFSGVSVTKERTYPYWEDGVRLELSDLDGHSLWAFPENSTIYDLLRAVRYQVAEVKEFLDDVLKDQGVAS